MKMDKKIPWNTEVVGLYREQKIFQEKKAKPGDSFRYRHYEPSINYVVGVAVRVKDEEEVEIDKVKQKLLRVEAVPDSIAGVQLPVTVFWLDKDLAVVQSRVEMAGLGKLVMTRSTKEAALRPVTPALISDVGVMQLIPLNKKIPGVHDTRSVVYKITLPGDENPATAIAVDARQKVENAEGKSFELHVRALRQPKPAKDPAPAAEEFLKSNYFINCDDEKVRELAKTAAGTEKDPWKKALKVERWVHAHMKSTNFTEAMATADHVARTLEGDCTEYAMLTAAMCRAEGVPSRTALGVVYAEVDKGKVHGPVLAYHMWTEVYVDGQWLAVDATLGRGGIGAGHIKITDHSWHDQRSLAPLLPVMRVMLAKPVIEVEQVEPESAPRRKEAGQ
jgi:transglutaminase-like putative cysteine protease